MLHILTLIMLLVCIILESKLSKHNKPMFRVMFSVVEIITSSLIIAILFLYPLINIISIILISVFGVMIIISLCNIMEEVLNFNKTLGLIVGRFQPFHIGHKYIIEKALNSVDILYICVSSYDKHGTERNPLSGDVRYEIMYEALSDYITDGRIILIPLDDLKGEDNNNPDWGDYLMSKVIEYTKGYRIDALIGGEEVCRSNWFSPKIMDYLRIISIPKSDINVSATKIRDMIIADDKSYVNYLPYKTNVSTLEDIIKSVNTKRGC